MPVNEDVRSRKCGAVRVKAIALAKVAFDFEVELLREIAGQIDASPAQPETIFHRSLTKPTFERGDVAVFEIRLNVSAKHQLEFRGARNDKNRRFLFVHDRFLDIRFPLGHDFRFHSRADLSGRCSLFL